jgi:hypothetical protein
MVPANSSSTQGVLNRAAANIKGSQADRAFLYHCTVLSVAASPIARRGPIPFLYPCGQNVNPPGLVELMAEFTLDPISVQCLVHRAEAGFGRTRQPQAIRI